MASVGRRRTPAPKVEYGTVVKVTGFGPKPVLINCVFHSWAKALASPLKVSILPR
jgi:hypothetical protein